jgi:ATP-dependent helicase/nuclease subunit B
MTQQKPFLALFEQAKRLILLLESLPEQERMLSYLQLERIVRSIYEPTQMTFRFAEVGHLPYVYHPAAITKNSEKTLWWNFVDNGQNPGFEFWYSTEFYYMNTKGIFPERLEQKNSRLLLQRKQAVLRTEEQLLLVLPDMIDGREVNPHPLWGDLHACFGKSLEKLSISPEKSDADNLLSRFYILPENISIQKIPFKKAAHFLEIGNSSAKLKARETETFSGLDNLLYYPYQWAFRYVLGLHKSSILSVVRQETLKGNLAHSAFEKLFNETKIEDKTWEKSEVYTWMEREIPILIEREAAVMMMYGQEAERRAFINMMKHAAWTLLSAIQNNAWKISGTEMEISGSLGDQPLKAKADLILLRGEETAVIDLKFSSADRYRKKIKNRDDLQLLIYSRFAAGPEDWAHTAYFIISRAQLLAKNNAAFAEAEALIPDEDFRKVNNAIWEKLITTYLWRIEQIAEGRIEIRNEKPWKP